MITFCKHPISTLFAFILFSIPAAQASNTDIGSQCLKVGAYGEEDPFGSPGNFYAYPIAYTSHNFGLSWSAHIADAFPPSAHSKRYLDAVSCNEQGTCMAVGRMHGTGYIKPLSYTSHDFGLTWVDNVPPASVFSNSEYVYFSDVACHAEGCVAVGPNNYYAEGSNIYRTLDFGQTWSVWSLPQSLHHVSCNAEGVCAVAGSYYNGVGTDALMYISTGFSDNWVTYHPASLDDYTSLSIVDCPTAEKCIALGSQMDRNRTLHQERTYTVDVVTGIGTWSEHILPSTPNQSHPQVNSLQCNTEGDCVAVGEYLENGEYKGLYYHSQDGGASWNMQTLSAPNDEDAKSVYIKDVSCDAMSNDCTAVGYYQYESSSYSASAPLSYTSSDLGLTWSEAVLPTRVRTPGDHFISGVYCQQWD